MTCVDQPKLAIRAAAELIGSFLVCFAIYAACSFGMAVYGVNMAFVAIVVALAYGAVTTMFASVSGAHLNPAITIAAVLTTPLKALDGLLYVIAQVVGALGAGFLVVRLLPTSDSITAKLWLTPTVNGFDAGSVSNATVSSAGITFGIGMAIALEVVASIVIVGTALSTMGTKRQGMAIGLAYGLGAAFTYPVTGAALNPIRATGIAVFAQNSDLTTKPLQQLWIFWMAPVLAAALVALGVIVAQMIQEAKPAKPADAEEDTEDTEAESEAETDVDDPEADVNADSENQSDAQISDQESQPQSDADESVERD